MGAPITPICAPFYIRSFKGSPPFFYGEDFSGFFPEPFPGVITPAALAIATLITAIIITAIIVTATGGTFIRVKVFSFEEIF